MAKSSGGNGLVVEVDLATELLRSKSNEVDQVFALMDQNAFNMGERIGVAMQKVADRFGVFAGLSQEQVDKVQASGEEIAKTYDKLAERIAKARVAGNDNEDGGLGQMREQIKVQRQKIAFAEQVIAKANAMRAAEGQLDSQIEQSVAAWNASRNASALRMKQLEMEVGALERMGIAEIAAARGHVDHANAADRNRAAMQQLSYQLNDISVGFATGTPPMQIFAQQSSQVIQAFQLMEGEGNKFLKFLGGPWGMAITAAVTLMLPIIANLDIFQDKVGDAAKKLREQAESEEIARQASERFASSLPGIIAAERKLTDELNRQIFARKELVELTLANAKGQETTAQTALNQAQQRLSQAQEALKRAESTPAVGNAMSGGFSQVERGRAKQEVDDAKKEVADARTALLDAQKNVSRAEVVQLQARARAAADPKVAAQQRIDASKDSLTNRYLLGMVNPAEYVSSYASLERQSAASKKSGPSADTLAKQAEAQRVKSLNDDTAYSEAERAARHKLLEAMGKTAASEDQRYSLLLEDINAETAAAKRKIANDLSAKKINAAEAEHLAGLVEQTRLQRIANADLTRTSEDVREAADADLRSLDAKIAMARIESDMAKTATDRRAAQLRLLDLEEQKARAEAQKTLADPLASNADKQAANDRIVQTDASHDANVEKVRNGTQSPMEAYKDRLGRATSDINTSLETVKVDGLKSLEDGLTGLISGTESAASAFKRMAASIIADLARIAIQKAIFAVIGLKDGGMVPARASGGLLGFRNGGLPGYAAGGTRLGSGMISGPGTGTSDSILALVNGKDPVLVSNGEGIVNERAVQNYWPMIDAMNKGTFPKFADGGLLSAATATLAYPKIPSAKSLAPAGQTVHQYFSIDAKGGILANDLIAELDSRSARYASAAAASAPAETRRQMAQRAEQRIT